MNGMCSPIVVYHYVGDIIHDVQLLTRYKRFLANVIVNGNNCVVFVPNTGSMLSLVPPTNPSPICALLKSKDIKRKYEYTIEMICKNNIWVGVHSALANKFVRNALDLRLLKELSDYELINQEVKVGECRIDFELILACDSKTTSDLTITEVRVSQKKRKIDVVPIERRMLIEVKSVTLASLCSDGKYRAEFPDCVSERASKHAKCLSSHVKQGGRAALVYIVQREDCDSFTTSPIDFKYQQAVYDAQQDGVQVLCYKVKLVPESGSVQWMGSLPFLCPFLPLTKSPEES